MSFQRVEDSSDIYLWNAGIIRRDSKAGGTCTYYWASVVHSQLEVKWDSQSRTALYFLDGNQISVQEARKFAKPGSGFAVGSKTPVGDPRFYLRVSNFSTPGVPPLVREKKKETPQSGINRLKNRYRQKYRQPDEPVSDKYLPSVPGGTPVSGISVSGISVPGISMPGTFVSGTPVPGSPVDCWQFTAMAVTENFIWVALRSIPRPPEALPRFRQPNGVWSQKHFIESSVRPVQGGVLRIEKDTGEFVRFTEKNGLPDSLICRPLSGESLQLPHFLPFKGFDQEVVAITPTNSARAGYARAGSSGFEENVRVRFTTRSNQHVWYDEGLGKWEDISGKM